MSNLSLKFQPWRDGAIMEELLRAFYPQKATLPDKRREACDTVIMWRRRANIPHDVDSTAALIEAQLHDDPDISSVEAIRSTYAEAFARFVTGLTDIQQTRNHKRSMYAVGRHINLPKSFVDLRHQITHEEMPSLTVLRDSTKRALRWLYIDYWEYWNNLCDTFYIVDGIPCREDGDVKQRLESVIHTHYSKCLKTFETEQPHRVAELNKTFSAIASRTITKNCRGEIHLLQIVVDTYLKGGILVPSSNISMRDMFSLFDVLLKQITRHNNKFLVLLTNEMSRLLVDNDHIDDKDDKWSGALHDWIVHIFKSETWENYKRPAGLKVDVAVDYLIANPGYWTLKAAYSIIAGRYLVQNKYKRRISKAWEDLKHSEAAIDKFGDLEEGLRDIQIESAEAEQPMEVEQTVAFGAKLELPDWTVSNQAGDIPRTVGISPA